MKKAIQYCRISEAEQSNWSLSGQQDSNQRFAERQNIELVQTFVDNGFSAKNFDRPGWKELMKHLSSNSDIDFVIVSKYDRLIRNVAEGLAIIEKLEQRFGVKILSVMENINIPPHSPFFFKMRADMLVNAEFERRVISDRSKFGTWNAKRQGRFIGQAPFGYVNKRDSSNKPIIEVDPNRIAAVKQIFDDFIAGVTPREIIKRAKPLGYLRNGHDAIKRLVGNPTYAGMIQVPAYGDYPEQLTDGNHEAIIDLDTYQKAQDILNNRNRRNRKIMDEQVPLRGYVCCESCEEHLTGGRSKGNGGYYHYYRCLKCTGENHNATKAHNQLIQVLNQLQLTSDKVEELQQATQYEFDQAMKSRRTLEHKLNKKLNELTTKLNAVEEKYITGMIEDSTYRKWHGIYQRDLFGKKIELDSIRNNNEQLLQAFINQLPKLMRLSSIYKTCTVPDKQKMLRILFGNILIKTKNGYRTFFLNPILESNSVIINGLDVTKKRDSTTESDQNPASTPTIYSIEPLVLFLQRINAA